MLAVVHMHGNNCIYLRTVLEMVEYREHTCMPFTEVSQPYLVKEILVM